MPFFSVIIPTYNQAHIIKRAIKSVLDQTSADFELIIVDDGSTDQTSTIAKSYRAPGIRYQYQVNAGVSMARNTGADMALGEYLVFLDGDDVVDTEWLMHFYRVIRRGAADVVFCDTIMNTDGCRSQHRISARDPYGSGSGGFSFLAGAFAVRKSFFAKAGGYDTVLRYAENTDLGWRIMSLNPRIDYTDHPGLLYCPGDHGGNKNAEQKIRAIKYLLHKHQEFFERERHVRRLYLQNAGVAAARLRQFKQAQKFFVQAWLIQIWKLKTLARLCIAFMPPIARIIWPSYYVYELHK